MSTKKTWIICVFLPLFFVIGIDQIFKYQAQSSAPELSFGILRITLFHNYGFILGSLKEIDKLYTVVIPSTFGAFLLYLFFVVQYFLPIKFPTMRIGISIFAAGVLSNIVDRIMHGYVIDYFQFVTPYFKTGIFNAADALQWLGLGIFFFAYITNGSVLYPPNERRGQKWIDPKFQLRFCLTLVFVGISFAVIALALSYTFLNVSVRHLSFEGGDTVAFLNNFIRIFTIVSLAFFISLFIIGVQLSWRIAGPIRAFEAYIEDILRGKTRDFKLRSGDEFQQLESLASKFHYNFHETLGMDPASLQAKDRAPQFHAQTYKGEEIKSEDFLGKKVWLIFYRYSTCPLCVIHIEEIKKTIKDITESGAKVLAIFENDKETFIKESTGKTAKLLRDLSIPLISDPERLVYRLYRNKINILALFKLKTIKRILEAAAKNFKQKSVDGKLGTLPAHFLINEDGYIDTTYYSKDMVDHIDIEIVRKFFSL